jgi:hypothetical protein
MSSISNNCIQVSILFQYSENSIECQDWLMECFVWSACPLIDVCDLYNQYHKKLVWLTCLTPALPAVIAHAGSRVKAAIIRTIDPRTCACTLYNHLDTQDLFSAWLSIVLYSLPKEWSLVRRGRNLLLHITYRNAFNSHLRTTFASVQSDLYTVCSSLKWLSTQSRVQANNPFYHACD